MQAQLPTPYFRVSEQSRALHVQYEENAFSQHVIFILRRDHLN